MRRTIRTAGLAALALLAAGGAAAGGADAPGAEHCRQVADDRAALLACLEAVTAPCTARRAEAGDAAWAGCMAERARDWEEAVARAALRVRAFGHPEGASGRAARWLATRSLQCREPNQVAALARQVGDQAATGAVAQCELVASILRTDQLTRLAGALEAARAAPAAAPLPAPGTAPAPAPAPGTAAE